MIWELPDQLSFEILNDLEWRPGPLEYFEMSDVGLVRRPHDLPHLKGMMRPGLLYSPELKGDVATRYRLHKLGEKRPIYLVPRHVFLNVFGKMLNEGVENVDYVVKMRAIVIEFNARNFRQDKRISYECKEEEGMLPMRKCATCGKKTRSYRCDACWAKIKAQSTSCEEPGAEYRIGRR